MFYEAVAEDDTRSIGMAVSPTGLDEWECLPEPVLQPGTSEASGNPMAWDAQGVGAPCALAMACEPPFTDVCTVLLMLLDKPTMARVIRHPANFIRSICREKD